MFIDGHAPTDEMEPSLIEWPEDTDDIVGPVLVLVVTLLIGGRYASNSIAKK